jgi:TonB-linked SusC/RagA family outer membrane protein
MKKKFLLKVIAMSKYVFYGLFVQSLLAGMLIASSGNAQSGKKLSEITLSLKDNTLRLAEAFRQIERKTNFNFIYNDAVVDGNRVVEVNVKQTDMYSLLSELSLRGEVHFKRINNNIFVTTQGEMPTESPGVEEIEPEQQRISGKVISSDDGQPLPGVSVLVKGTNSGTVTDVNGAFAISAAEGATLQFSYIGYSTQELVVGTQTELSIVLKPDMSQLEEVVVVGYGTVRKSDLTGSVAQVKAEDITAFPVPTVDQALKGRAPGVRVTQNSGRPGARIQIQIRGGNSIIGDNSPLFVVDGFPLTGGVDFLNPADIESIDILKDASATAIYGARGANGVVIITTKKGLKERGTVTLDSYYGVQQARKTYDLMNARQFAEVANEAAVNDNLPLPFDLNNLDNVNTDWQDLVFRNAPIQSHTLTFNGGGQRSTYSVSAGYFGQDGVVINTGLQRGNLRIALDQQVNDWVKVSSSVALSRIQDTQLPTDNGHRGNGVLSGAFVSPPTVAPFNSDGTFADVAAYPFSPNVLQNPLAFAQIDNRNAGSTMLGNIAVDFNLAKGLTLKVLGGTEQLFQENNFYSPSILVSSPTGTAATSISRGISYLNENILKYTTDLGKNKLTLTGGFTYQSSQNRFNRSAGSGFVNDILLNNNLGSAEITQPNISSVTEWTLLSWLGRANFSLGNKWLFTASFRSDGSSRFGENQKWGFFPSGAVAWRLVEENFIENLGVFSDLKIRTSYGVTGSTAVAPYQSLNRLSPFRNTYGGADVIGFAPSAIPNPDLRWETTGQFNVGIDAAFINDRLRVTADYYQKNTYDLLARIPLPVSVGFSSIITNLGEVRNTGIELGIGYDILVNAVKWTVFGQLSSNRNEVVDLGGSDVFGAGISLPFGQPINIVREGQPLGVFYGFRENGLDENGQIVFKDLNNDGVITNADQEILGTPYPSFIYSLNSNLSYKNFELNVFLEGVNGNQVFFATGGSISNSFNTGENQLVDVYNNRWRPDAPDPNAKYPRLSRSTAFRVSDRFIENGSYLRLQNIRLAYNLPTENLKIKGVNSLQLYLSTQNLLVVTKYPGLDPEVNSHGAEGDLRIGLDETAYPTSRAYTFGIKLGF